MLKKRAFNKLYPIFHQMLPLKYCFVSCLYTFFELFAYS